MPCWRADGGSACAQLGALSLYLCQQYRARLVGPARSPRPGAHCSACSCRASQLGHAAERPSSMHGSTQRTRSARYAPAGVAVACRSARHRRLRSAPLNQALLALVLARGYDVVLALTSTILGADALLERLALVHRKRQAAQLLNGSARKLVADGSRADDTCAEPETLRSALHLLLRCARSGTRAAAAIRRRSGGKGARKNRSAASTCCNGHVQGGPIPCASRYQFSCGRCAAQCSAAAVVEAPQACNTLQISQRQPSSADAREPRGRICSAICGTRVPCECRGRAAEGTLTGGASLLVLCHHHAGQLCARVPEVYWRHLCQRDR